MFEAKLDDGSVIRKLIDSIKDLVTDANLECSGDGISLQAMDSSHVSLVALLLRKDGFDSYRADRNISLGLNLGSVAKILKCAAGDDSVTIRADDDGDAATFLFEGKDGDRISEFELKLMDIDSEHLGIPDTEYKCTVKMPAGEFQRIVRDMAVLGDTCTIGVSKEGVRFHVKGDLGVGSILRKSNKAGDKEAQWTVVEMEEPTDLTFALRYLNFFTKATPLADSVTLHLSKEVPLMVEYKLESLGYLRYFLAPKIDEDAA